MFISTPAAGHWSYSLPAVKTVNFCMVSHPAPPGLAESSPPLLLSPLPRIPPLTAGASSLSISPSSPGAKLLTWLPLAAPQMAMQACTPPCPHSARPPWTSTNSTCPARSRAKSQMRERTGRKRWTIPHHANKVGYLLPFKVNVQLSLAIIMFLNEFTTYLPHACYDTDLSVREESDNDQNQSDDGDPEASPTKSPTTPKNIKCKNSSGISCLSLVHYLNSSV